MLGLQPDYLLRLSRRTAVVFAFSPSTPQSNAFRRRSQLLIVTAHQAEPNFRNASICDGEVTLWVKLRNTQHEQMSSALTPRTDIDLSRPRKNLLRGSNVMKCGARDDRSRIISGHRGTRAKLPK